MPPHTPIIPQIDENTGGAGIGNLMSVNKTPTIKPAIKLIIISCTFTNPFFVFTIDP